MNQNETQNKKTKNLSLATLRANLAWVCKSTRGSLVVRFERDTTAPSYQSDRAIVTIECSVRSGDSYNSPRETRTVTFPGWIGAGHDDQVSTRTHEGRPVRAYEGGIYAPASGAWSLYAIEARLRSVIDLLPSDAELTFRARLDWHTNPIHVDARLHGDALELQAEVHTASGRTKTYEFLIDSHVGLHNSARFGHAR